MFTREEVENNQLIDPDILDIIPDTCECGAEVVFSDSLKQIMCSNPRCYHKIAFRLEGMAKAMQADGFGESTCEAICSAYKLKSPYQVFLLEGKAAPEGVAAFDKKIYGITHSPALNCELWQMVAYGGIPGIDTIAYKLFGEYDNITDAYADIEKYQVPFIAEKLGQKSGGSGVMAVNIYNTLFDYKAELLFAEQYFNIKKKSGDRLQIAITDSVEGYSNKSAFVNELNLMYEGKVSIVRLNSVTGEVSYLIADGDTGSNKYKKALRMQEKGYDIQIVASKEFKQILAEKYGGQ